METNGTLGETLAWILITQSTKRQHQSTLWKLSKYYCYKSRVFFPTPLGVQLLEVIQPSFIWEHHKFLTGLGYEVRQSQTNRLDIEYVHKGLVFSNVLRRVALLDRKTMVNSKGENISKLLIKRGIEDAFR